MSSAALSALMSHWRRRPGQLATLILGLALATALWAGVQAINAEARAGYDRATQTARLAALPSITGTADRPLTIADFTRLRRAGWPVTPILEGRLTLGRSTLNLTGIDPLTHPMARAFSGEGLAAPGWLRGPGFILTDPATADRLGDRTDLPRLIGRADLTPGTGIADIALVERLLPTQPPLTRLDLTGPAPGPLENGLVLTRAPDVADISGLTQSFHLNLTAFGFLAFAVGLFIAHSAIGLAFEDRRAMFRTLRALGVPLHALIALVAVELTVIALIAASLGLAMGYLIAAALLPDVAATLRGLYGAPVAGGLTLRPGWVLAGLGLTLAGTGIAATGAFWSLARLPILAAAQPRAWARGDTRTTIRLAAFGAVLIIAGAIAGWLGNSLITGFVLLAGLMLGAALVLPAFLTLAVSLSDRIARRPLPQWFWADTRQQLPGLRLALMALLLALAANIGVGTMVASFRQTFTGWLDQRLITDLTVVARSNTEAAAITASLSPDRAAVLPIWRANLTVAGRRTEVFGVADHPAYSRNWPMLETAPAAWTDLHQGDAILVSEQSARRTGLSLGDRVDLMPGWSPRIVGIYPDYGNPADQIITGLDRWQAAFPVASRRTLGLILTDRDDLDTLRSDLLHAFDLPASAITDRATIRRFSLGIFERTFSVTAALNALTLGVAGIAILTSLLTLSAMRLPQLAPVWAIGVRRRRLAGLELIRALALAGFTFAAALPLGLALAWVLLSVINAQAFGWRLPVHVFPADWLWLAGLAGAAAVVSAAWPAWTLARMTPAALTKVFSHAR